MKESGIFLLISLLCISLLFSVGVAFCCNTENETIAPDLTFDQLSTNPNKYTGKQISIEGYYFDGFETIVLTERLDYSGSAEGHIVPKGVILWIEGGIPEEIYDGLYQQHIMGPIEYYGKLRVTGLFNYGGKYGHLGQFNYQITPIHVELIPWVPPS